MKTMKNLDVFDERNRKTTISWENQQQSNLKINITKMLKIVKSDKFMIIFDKFLWKRQSTFFKSKVLRLMPSCDPFLMRHTRGAMVGNQQGRMRNMVSMLQDA